jgi:TatA/E family protein of Tat protein translocase
MFGRLGWAEILVIVVLLVILFGHKAIPGMMKNVANGINTFKSELKNGDKKSPAKKVSKKGAENRTAKNKLKK